MLNVELISVIVGILGTLVGGATSTDIAVKALSQLFKRFAGVKQTALPLESRHRSTVVESMTQVGGTGVGVRIERARFGKAYAHLLRRIGEAESQQRRNYVTAQILRFSSGVLTTTQILVGAMMTTAFIKNMLSPTVVGIFGLVVVVSSSINQKFSPGVGAQVAFQKADLFKALIRATENKLVVIETEADQNDDDPKPVNDLTTKFSTEVRKIEAITKKNHKTPP
jgi:hypothetical protein